MEEQERKEAGSPASVACELNYPSSDTNQSGLTVFNRSVGVIAGVKPRKIRPHPIYRMLSTLETVIKMEVQRTRASILVQVLVLFYLSENLQVSLKPLFRVSRKLVALV